MSATATGKESLHARLSDPVTKQEIADLLGVSIATVYDSLGKYRAALEAGDREAMRANIPCLVLGAKGTRMIVPRRAFVAWYESCGAEVEP